MVRTTKPELLVSGCSYPRAERAQIARNYYGRGLSFEERARAWYLAYVDTVADFWQKISRDEESEEREKPEIGKGPEIVEGTAAHAALGTLLDAEETSARHYLEAMEPAERDEIMALVSAYCHKRHRAERFRVAIALTSLGVPKMVRRYLQCCSVGWVLHSAKGRDGRHFFAVANRCKSRHCPACAKARAKLLVDRFDEAIKTMSRPRLMTLTIRQQEGRSLTDTMKALHKGWRRIKRYKRWNRYVRGGIAVIEVKKGANGWNAHYHVVCDGKFYPHDELVADWLQATGDSFVVDIRQVKQAEMAKYLAKYVAKPSPHVPDDELPEFIVALHGRRLFSAFGTMAGEAALRADESDERLIPDDAKPVGTLAHFVCRARVGDQEAQTILRAAWPFLAIKHDARGKSPP